MWISTVFLGLVFQHCNAIFSLFPTEVYNAIYGDMSVDDVTPSKGDGKNLPNDILKNTTLTDLLQDAYTFGNDENLIMLFNTSIDSEFKSHDVNEFDEMNSQILNFTRKRKPGYWWGHDDLSDKWFWYIGRSYELDKINTMKKVCMQFLIHARYKIAGALEQREASRRDKRYRLGYLFNRLRRLHTEMLKVVNVAKTQQESGTHTRFQSLLRLYERVARFDVDIRDTTQLIKDTYREPAKFDNINFNPDKR